nr:mechanosensitive ion channel family protein [uncultured Mogibacterium sp.]
MDIIVKMVTSTQFISSIIIILVTIIATIVIEHTHKLYVKKTNNTVQMNAIVRSTFRLMKSVTWIIAALAVLEVNNIRVTSIIAGVGVAGAVFGMAMQDVFKDVLMGMHIINDKAFKVGDVIKIDDDEGIVTLFTLQTTQYTSLNTGDNVTICNRNITKVGITNGVYDIDIGLRYNEDPEHVREVLTECAKKIKAVKGIKNSEYLAVQSFDATSAIYRIRYWCKPKDKWVTRRAAMGVLQKCLLESDIVLPYSQLDVHVNDSDGK